MNFVIQNQKIIQKLQDSFGSEEKINLNHLIDVYLSCVKENMNMADDDTLGKLFCKDVGNRCQLDSNIKESGKIIGEAKTTVATIVEAVEVKDFVKVKEAAEELGKQHFRLEQIETEFYTDEETKLYNRRYLYSKKLEDAKQFGSSGNLFVFQIKDFASILENYGVEVGDSIIKHFARNLHTLFNVQQYSVVRYSSESFVLFATDDQKDLIERKLRGYQVSLAEHKFKTKNNDTVQYNFNYAVEHFKEDDYFLSTYQDLSAKLLDGAA